MSIYPRGWKDPHEHLLFDIGYSYSLLKRVQGFLGELDPAELLNAAQRVSARELFTDIATFERERLKATDDICAAARGIKLEGLK